MEFILIFSSEDGRAKEIYSSYENTFPADERRNRNQFNALFHNPNAKVFSIQQDQENIGYLITWHVLDFRYIEHFEVFSTFRNQNLGSEILKEFSEIQPQLILESEPATQDEIAHRRINFYQRNGFSIVDKNYIQPPYEKGKKALNLWLLSNVEIEDPQKIIKKIHQVVYQVD